MEKLHFSHEELSSFCLSLAHLLQAGLTGGDALALLAQDAQQAEQKALFSRLSEEADGGALLSRVLSDRGFPDYLCVMTAAGEQTGRLEEALFALADYYESRLRLERRMRAALTQPLVLLVLLLLVVVVLLGWVLPVFDEVYRQLGTSLTGVAGLLLRVGLAIRKSAPVLLPLLALLCAGLYGAFRSERGRARLVALLEKGGAFARADAARLTQVLALALRSGLSGEQAMELAQGLGAEGSELQRKCQVALEALRGAETLPRALETCGLLPAAECRLLEAGLQSGCPDTVMTRIARRVQEGSEAAMDARLDRIEPALVLAAGLLVGLILLSVLLPLTGMLASLG